MQQRRQAGKQSGGKDYCDKTDITALLMPKRRERRGIQRRGKRPAPHLEGSRNAAHRYVPGKANGPPVAGH